MFKNATSFDGNVSLWDTSKVKDMSVSLFRFLEFLTVVLVFLEFVTKGLSNVTSAFETNCYSESQMEMYVTLQNTEFIFQQNVFIHIHRKCFTWPAPSIKIFPNGMYQQLHQ